MPGNRDQTRGISFEQRLGDIARERRDFAGHNTPPTWNRRAPLTVNGQVACNDVRSIKKVVVRLRL